MFTTRWSSKTLDFPCQTFSAGPPQPITGGSDNQRSIRDHGGPHAWSGVRSPRAPRVLEDGLDVSGPIGVGLVPSGSIATLDGAIHFLETWEARRRPGFSVGAGLFELGHELGTSIDLDGFDGERHVSQHLVEEECRRSEGRAVESFGDGPFGDRIVGGGVLDGFVGGGNEEAGIELNEASGAIGPDVAGQAHGVRYALLPSGLNAGGAAP
jgi:hypothetical protein